MRVTFCSMLIEAKLLEYKHWIRVYAYWRSSCSHIDIIACLAKKKYNFLTENYLPRSLLSKHSKLHCTTAEARLNTKRVCWLLRLKMSCSCVNDSTPQSSTCIVRMRVYWVSGYRVMYHTLQHYERYTVNFQEVIYEQRYSAISEIKIIINIFWMCLSLFYLFVILRIKYIINMYFFPFIVAIVL